jgi:hypothetical protein
MQMGWLVSLPAPAGQSRGLAPSYSIPLHYIIHERYKSKAGVYLREEE